MIIFYLRLKVGRCLCSQLGLLCIIRGNVEGCMCLETTPIRPTSIHNQPTGKNECFRGAAAASLGPAFGGIEHVFAYCKFCYRPAIHIE